MGRQSSRAKLIGALIFASCTRSLMAQAPAPFSAPPFAYLTKSRFAPAMRDGLRSIGNRLEVPGNERVTMTGTLSQTGSSPGTAQIIVESATSLRLDYVVNGVAQTIIFDGANIYGPASAAAKAEADVVSSLVGDTVEQFFIGSGAGYAVRHLGDKVRLSNRTDVSVQGLCDLYALSNNVKIAGKSVETDKMYCFDSASHLLRGVYYKQTQNGGSTAVIENRFDGWHSVNGQFLPGKVTRFENSQAVLTFIIAGAVVGPKVQDATFAHP